MTIATVANDNGGPVEGKGLEVGQAAGEKDVVVGVVSVEDAVSAGDRDNLDGGGRVDNQGNLGALEGLGVDLVTDLGGELEDGRLVVTPAPRVVGVVLAGHVD